ncbi:MAG: FtsQ-type POTRA domain-containing protein [Deferribacterales bacterium]
MSEYLKIFFRMVTMLLMLSVIFGLFYSINLFSKSSYFSLNKLEIIGQKNANIKKIDEQLRHIINENILKDITISDKILDDPWIKKLYIKKSYPNKLKVIISERQTIMKISTHKRCFFYSLDGELLPTKCNDVKVFDYTKLNSDKLLTTAKILSITKNSEYNKVSIYNSHITMELPKYTILVPHDYDTFKKNITYISGLSTMYKTINYIDIRIPGKIYINGVHNET